MGNLGKLKNLKNLESFEDLDEIDKKDEKMVDLVFVLDKSGSMWGSESDVIGGFNSLITKEKKLHPNTIVTLVLFDTEYKVIYTRKDISEVEELTSDVYYADGCTALLDAVGTTINRLDKKDTENVLFVIATDGLENSSREFSRDDIKKMIKSHEWEFLFLGADIDSFSEASSIGISSSHTANYKKTSASYGRLFNSVRRAKLSIHNGLSLKDGDWKRELEK